MSGTVCSEDQASTQVTTLEALIIFLFTAFCNLHLEKHIITLLFSYLPTTRSDFSVHWTVSEEELMLVLK